MNCFSKFPYQIRYYSIFTEILFISLFNKLFLNCQPKLTITLRCPKDPLPLSLFSRIALERLLVRITLVVIASPLDLPLIQPQVQQLLDDIGAVTRHLPLAVEPLLALKPVERSLQPTAQQRWVIAIWNQFKIN